MRPPPPGFVPRVLPASPLSLQTCWDAEVQGGLRSLQEGQLAGRRCLWEFRLRTLRVLRWAATPNPQPSTGSNPDPAPAPPRQGRRGRSQGRGRGRVRGGACRKLGWGAGAREVVGECSGLEPDPNSKLYVYPN